MYVDPPLAPVWVSKFPSPFLHLTKKKNKNTLRQVTKWKLLIDNNGPKAYICSTLIKLNKKFERMLSHQNEGRLLWHSSWAISKTQFGLRVLRNIQNPAIVIIFLFGSSSSPSATAFLVLHLRYLSFSPISLPPSKTLGLGAVHYIAVVFASHGPQN